MSNKEPREALGARDGETLLDAAKRVVRERDEADSRYQSEHCHRLSLQSEVDAVRAVLGQAERERDEALDRANTLAVNCESYFQGSCRMRKERDEARATLELVEDQLEEAEAKLKSGEAEWATRRCECSADETCKFVRERDEARAKLDAEYLKHADAFRLAREQIEHWKRRTEYAFERGAEAMREACAEEVGSFTAWNDPPSLEFLEEKVRALPIPGEP